MEPASYQLVSHSVIAGIHFYGSQVSQTERISPTQIPSLIRVLRLLGLEPEEKLNTKICNRVKLSSVSIHIGINNILII